MNIFNSRKYKCIYRDRKHVSGFLGTGAKRKMDYKETQGNLGGVRYPDLGDGFPSIHICQKSSNCIL